MEDNEQDVTETCCCAERNNHIEVNCRDGADTTETILIIGAGVAGLAAGRKLQQAGLPVLILEARDRIGGRIHTDHHFAPYPTELGAEFVHGENVSTWGLLRETRLKATQVFASEANHFIFFQGSLKPVCDLQNHAIGRALDLCSVYGSAVLPLIRAWQQSGKPDQEVSTVLQSALPNMSSEMRTIVESSYQGLNAADLHELSAFGLLEGSYAGDGDRDYRIDDGYSAWLEVFARGVPVRLSDPVKFVRWSKLGIDLLTESNKAYHAKRLIVTLPLALLQQGYPEFDPGLPQPQLLAVRRLASGPITKILLRFREPFWPSEAERFLNTLDTRFFWRTGWGRTDENPGLTIFVGASTARKFNQLGCSNAIKLVLNDLKSIFGADQSRNLLGARFLDWQADPFCRMGYSFVRPGGLGARAQLATPTENVIFWAGEATDPLRPATVHGAVESGFRAASEVLESFG